MKLLSISGIKNSSGVKNAFINGHRLVTKCEKNRTDVISKFFQAIGEEIEMLGTEGCHTIFGFRNCDLRYIKDNDGKEVFVTEVAFLF